MSETRKRIQGAEFRLIQHLLATEREATDWAGPLLFQWHRDIFGALFPAQAGRIRTEAEGLDVVHFGPRVSVRSGQIDARIQQLVARMREEITDARAREPKTREWVLDVADAAARSHAEMIAIHPFVDGNGRWARAVTTAFLRDCGITYGTIFRSQDKPRYLEALNRATDTGECGDLRRLILRGMNLQVVKRQGYRLGVAAKDVK